MSLSFNEIKWLGDQVEQIPGDAGWWHQSGSEEYTVLAVELVELGVDRFKALEILTKAYWVAANEFGL